jgi:hypothetical protein
VIDLVSRINSALATRAAASQAAARVLTAGIDGLSEVAFRDRWLHEMRENSDILPEGWYSPPPMGLSVLIADPPAFERLNFSSLRDTNYWPANERKAIEGGAVFMYCGPVNRRTAMIGDFQLTLYRGSSNAMRDHVDRALAVTIEIAQRATVGMTLGELFQFAASRMSPAGLSNNTLSVTDKIDRMNIGHTVPWTYGAYDDRIWGAIAQGDASEVASIISESRIFLTADQSLAIPDDIAFTIEPQLSAPGLPKVSFHLMVAFRGGQKTIACNFGHLFDLAGMKYLSSKSREHIAAWDGLPFI